MSKDPAILFYTSDFLTGTMFLSDEQVGRYIRLLCAQHQKGRLTKKDMLNICKSHDDNIFDKFTVDKEGLYFNERLENEAKKRKAYSESRSKNRTGKKKDMINISDTYVNHMENENENKDVIEDKNKVEIWPTFDDFWNAYNKKVGSKSNVEKKFLKLNQDTKEIIMNYIFDYVEATPDKQYRVNPETFLNQKRWENEIINQNGKQGLTTERDQYFREHDPDYSKY